MSDQHREEPIREHVAAIAARTDGDVARLTQMLRRSAWPGGSDRTVPAALQWLRRWSPNGPVPVAVACGCADGRCLVCN